MPSKLWIGAEIGPVPLAFCTTGSFAPGGAGPALSDSIGRLLSGDCGTGSTGSELTAGDVPSSVPLTMCGPNDAVPPVVLEDTGVPTALARAMP